jgi:hypothetical protein
MCDWMIGTERRNRVDWKVLPRSPDDVKMADVKTQTLKYVADVNHVAHNRSRAFADAVKVGIGWMEDGVRADPTADPIYSRYEDWRCILHDSTAYDYLGDEGRYNFKWRWVDADVACLMFPKRAGKIKRAVEDWARSGRRRCTRSASSPAARGPSGGRASPWCSRASPRGTPGCRGTAASCGRAASRRRSRP